ncbi:MAG TPA: fluoride efflux transporter CrcB [Firmicutes bacterium]|nr:fluoride efflux transporter CrcB [Bacillota bacterium]
MLKEEGMQVMNLSYVAVAIGGFLGALARFGMGQGFAGLVQSTGFPWGTLVINLLGCFVLALFLTVTLDLFDINPLIRVGFSTGFLGAFTTFSTFSMETIQLIRAGQYWYTGLYLFCSIFLCIAMAALGFMVTRGIVQFRANQQGMDGELEK